MSMNNDDQGMDLPKQRPAAPWMVVLAVLVGFGGLGYGFYSHGQTAQILDSQKSDRQGTSDMQAQMQTLRNRLMAREERERELTAALAVAEQRVAEIKAAKPEPVAAVQRAAASPRPKKRTTTARPTAEDPRLSQLEKRITEHDEKLASTQKLVETARTDLEGRIDSTSQELNGSIAAPQRKWPHCADGASATILSSTSRSRSKRNGSDQ